MLALRTLSILMVSAIFTSVAFAKDTGKTAAPDFGYATVALALQSMRAKSGVNSSVESGWIVIEDPSTLTVWSFTPPTHSAHPAAVRRKIIQEGDTVLVQSNILCEGPKPACDALAVEFDRLDQAVRESLKSKPPAKR